MPNGKRTIADLTKLANIVTGGDLTKVGVGTGFGGGGDDPLIYWAESLKELPEATIQEIGNQIDLLRLPKPEYAEKIGKKFYYEFYVTEN